MRRVWVPNVRLDTERAGPDRRDAESLADAINWLHQGGKRSVEPGRDG